MIEADSLIRWKNEGQKAPRKNMVCGFPGGTFVVKNAIVAGFTEDTGSIPGLGSSPTEEN